MASFGTLRYPRKPSLAHVLYPNDLFDFMVNRVKPYGGTAIFVPCMSSTLTTRSIS